MVNILWSALNAGLLLGFFYLAFRAIWLLKQHTSLGAALLFGLGLLLVINGKSGSAAAAASPRNLLDNPRPDTLLGNGSALQAIPLGFNTLQLVAEYYDTAGIIQPRGLYATVAGLTLGHQWQPLAGSLRPQGRQLRCQIAVNHTWLLLGAPVFSSVSKFESVLSAAKPH